MQKLNQHLYDEIVSNSNIVTGDEYNELVYTISKVASDMVVKTLGPYGSTTVIDDGTGFTYPSKDGWSCLSKLQFTDPTYNTIYNMLKTISFNSAATVGDGTTTAMVAANQFLTYFYEVFLAEVVHADQFRQADFISTMAAVAKELEERLRNNPNILHIDEDGDYRDIHDIAYIATNGNHKFAKTIQKIYQETNNPHIQVVIDNLDTVSYEIQTGYRFEARTLNYPVYINDESGGITKKTPQRIIIFDHNVTFQSHQTIIGYLSKMSDRDNMPTIIMAPYFDDIITSWIDGSVQNMVQSRKVPNIMLIQIPTTMQIHRQTLSDLSILTNGQIFDDGKVKAFNILFHNATHDEGAKVNEDLLSLENYKFSSPEDVIASCIGTTSNIRITKSEGFLMDYMSTANEVKYRALLAEAKETYMAAKNTATKSIGGTLSKEYLFTQMRYIKLNGNIGIIKIGGLSDIQQRCDKDSVDDAVLACRSAFENGYVRGMNLEILSIIRDCIEELDGVKLTTLPYEQNILDMLNNAFYASSLQVLNNKRPDNAQVERVNVKGPIIAADNTVEFESVGVFGLTNPEILDMAISDNAQLDYNLRTEEMNPRSAWTVINSTATDIEILRAVVNVLTTIITSNQFLSMTRRYDPKVNTEKAMARRLEDERRIVATKASAVLDSIMEPGVYEALQMMFGGVHIDGMSMDLDTEGEVQDAVPVP